MNILQGDASGADGGFDVIDLAPIGFIAAPAKARTMNDLFDWKNPAHRPVLPYGGPGYKEHTTSKAAAAKMAPRAPTLRDQVLVAITDVWPAGLTADEAAAAVGATVLAVRPRLSELKAMGKIIPTAITRPNISGIKARVMVARRSS